MESASSTMPQALQEKKKKRYFKDITNKTLRKNENLKAQKEKRSHAIMTTDANLLNLSIFKKVDKNISELTIFANCYKSHHFVMDIFRGLWGGKE